MSEPHDSERRYEGPFLPLDIPLNEEEVAKEDLEAFKEALRRSKIELDIARSQFDSVTDPMLIDHVIFRIGAAERHFSYLLQLARRLNIELGKPYSDWYQFS